jgi:hypothetical protein
MYSHLIEAKRSAARCSLDTSGLYPRMHRKLVEAVRIGSQVAESVVVSGLTDKAAYRLESRANFTRTELASCGIRWMSDLSTRGSCRTNGMTQSTRFTSFPGPLFVLRGLQQEASR